MKIDGRSTENFALDDAVKRLRGEPGTDVVLTILRRSSNQTKDYKLTRAAIKVDTVKDINGKRDFPLGENSIGYIRLTQFGEKTASDFEKALKKLEAQGMKALILDLRGNPGGLLDQGTCHGHVVDVAGRQHEQARPALSVGQSVQLTGATPAGDAYGLAEGPPFAPPAERCALMWVASMATVPQMPL